MFCVLCRGSTPFAQGEYLFSNNGLTVDRGGSTKEKPTCGKVRLCGKTGPASLPNAAAVQPGGVAAVPQMPQLARMAQVIGTLRHIESDVPPRFKQAAPRTSSGSTP